MTIKPELKPKNTIIVLNAQINYSKKITLSSTGTGVKKKNEKPLSVQIADELKKIIFQKGSPYLAKAWHQGFILSPFK